MAYLFNEGTDLELYVTRYVWASYFKVPTPEASGPSMYLAEELRPFNAAPLVEQLLDHTPNYVTLLKENGSGANYEFRLKVDPEGTTQYKVAIYMYYGGSYSQFGEGKIFNRGTIPEHINFYFGYNIRYAATPSEWGGTACDFYVFYSHYQKVYVTPGDYHGYEYLMGGPSPGAGEIPVENLGFWSWVPDASYIPTEFFRDPTTIIMGPDTMADTLTKSGSFAIGPTMANLLSADGTTPEPIDPPGPEPEPFDPSTPTPYDPNPDDTSDQIDIPSDPPVGVSNAGFINIYKPSLNALQSFGDVIFPEPPSASDVSNAIQNLYNVIANSNLINYVIDCHVIPVAPTTGSTQQIKVGYRTTTIQAPKVTSDYVNKTCGSLAISEYFGSFADYITTAKLFLPFLGFVETLPEFYQAGTISVDYKFNVIDGSFMAYVRATSSKSKLNGSVIAQYAGNACMHFPLTGMNYSNMVSGLVGAAATLASGGGASAVLGAATSASNAMKSIDVQQSNGYNATASILSIRTPFLMIARPVPSYPAKYAHDKGYPSNITMNLAQVSGFASLEDIDLSGIPLTQAEIEELRGLLKEGVYF